LRNNALGTGAAVFRRWRTKANDWTKRYPWIAESALKNRIKHFVIDSEAVVLGELR
jgi:bifunctional non-homologous end joining protein LigD